MLVTGRVVPAEDEVAVWVGAEDAPGVVPLPDVQATAASEMAMSTTHGPLERAPVRCRLNDIRADIILRVPPQGWVSGTLRGVARGLAGGTHPVQLESMGLDEVAGVSSHFIDHVLEAVIVRLVGPAAT